MTTSKSNSFNFPQNLFLNLYIEHQYNKSRNTALIADNSFDENGRKTVSLLRVDAPPAHIHHIDKQFKVGHFKVRRHFSPPNFSEFSKNMVLAGSVNGIVCVTNEIDFAEAFVGLWNPSRKVWKAIELPRTKSWKNKSVGLGFDSETNDCKVICIVPVPHGGSWSKIQIYSNNQDMWAQCNLDGIVPFRPQETLHCKFVFNGVPYWLGHNWKLGDFQFFARVNPCTGLFQTFQFPQDVNPALVDLVKLRESVAALVKCPSKYASIISVDLYLMDEKCGSWMKLYCIGSFECDRMWIPQCMGTGEIVIFKSMHFGDNVTCFCNPDTGHVFHNTKIEEFDSSWFMSYSHVESPVCLSGMMQIGMEHRDKNKDLVSKKWASSLSNDFESVLHL
ncbi:hypothetical protein POM88_033601 [Heracleum sosnowskyi]|uniref:F-box associated beta-propeller type 3 domain-containing protein n=1 Tax=Heracleum sosnowskyi TaxID=360622 RepID=A0AAD8HHZ5_9APIA|nr:hypothetical protein POM88_033601 [Heracleum sosnowskyi]